MSRKNNACGESHEQNIELVFRPKNDKQKEVIRCWDTTKVLFLSGQAGTGKSHVAIAMGMRDVVKNKKPLWLSRPTVGTSGKELGYNQGDILEKFLPWLSSLENIVSKITKTNLKTLIQKELIVTKPVSFLRGDTADSTLLIDECQNLDYDELLCVLTRCGETGRIVLCGDPDQHDLASSPFEWFARRLDGLDGFKAIHFEQPSDNCRSPIVASILDRCNEEPRWRG